MTTFFTKTLRVLALACALAHAPAAPAAPNLADYQHTTWTQENGAPPSIGAMAQTADGWLWLGTDDGLYRFDGVAFERYAPPDQPAALHRRILELHAAAGGDLFIAYFPQDVGVLHADGRFEMLPRAAAPWGGGIETMTADADGSLWVVAHGLHHFAHGAWFDVGADVPWVTTDGTSLLLDQDARLWAANMKGVWRLDRARGRFERITERAGDLAQTPDGAVWALPQDGQPAFRLAPSASGKPRPARANAATSRYVGLFDAKGSLWTLGGAAHLRIVHDGAALASGSLAPPDPEVGGAAPGQAGEALLEDREGNVWMTTRTSLERFRAKRFLASGLGRGGAYYSIAADDEGHVWAAERDTGKLWQLRPDGTPLAQAAPWTGVVATGHDGALLLGGRRSILRRRHGQTEEIALPPGPDGKPADLHLLGILDDGAILWTAAPETGLIAWAGGKWQPGSAFHMPPQIYLTNADGPGRQWLAMANGELILHDHDAQTHYDARALGALNGIFPATYPGAPLVVGGENGLAVLRDGRLQPLAAADPDVLRGVSGIAATADGDLWLNGAAGVLHVRAADWRAALGHPGAPLRYELFGAFDGYPGRAEVTGRHLSAFSADGRHVWFVGSGGIAGLDSADLRRNPVPPQPRVLDVVTDAGRFGTGAGADLRLPPGANAFRVQFTAPALRQPERVRFQYRLDGVDAHWQDAGARRTTSYTNVAPGDYVFRLRAVNEDGVPSRDDVALRMSIAPTLVQSLPFKVACAVALLALATLLYRLRVQVLTRRLTERLTERLQVKLAERERIARTLHDTILQAVQALMLRLDSLARGLPKDDATRGRLETMLHEAGDAIGAGRDQVRELRAAVVPALDEVARACAAELRALHPGVAFELHADAAARELHPAVAEEAGHVVCEALRNAFQHAHARHIAVRLEFGRRALVATVRDDGRGLDEDVARAGYRSGHWGLIGMRERAARIGAQLRIEPGAHGGLTVALSVPAARAYAADAA